jgi:GDP-L-fucose synthase
LLTGSIEPTNEGYAIAKISGVRLAKAISDECDLNYFTLMPTNLFGPNDQFDLEKAHVPAALIRRFHEAKVNNVSHVKLWGTGTPLREFMHVDDLADAIWFFLELGKLGGNVINIGSGHELSIADFSRLVASVIGCKGKIDFDATNPDGVPRKRLDLSHAENLGWKAKLSLESSLESTYDWYLDALSKGKLRGI